MVTDLLTVTGLTYTYPRRRHDRPAVAEVTFATPPGRLVFLLGPNGSGKSTLFRLLLGLLRPDRGRIILDDRDVAETSVRRLARTVAYVPQAEDTPFDFTVREVVLMGRTPHLSALAQRTTPEDHVAVEESLATLGIEHLGDVGIRSLSGGERQLVLLARALAQEGRLLVLDEPTSALDFANQTRVLAELERLADAGLTLLVSSHNPMHALSHADHVLLLKQGRLVGAGHPDEITERDLSELYETPLRLVEARDEPGLRMCLPAREPRAGQPLQTRTPA